MAEPERGPVPNYINPASLDGRGFVVLGAGGRGSTSRATPTATVASASTGARREVSPKERDDERKRQEQACGLCFPGGHGAIVSLSVAFCVVGSYVHPP